MTDPEELLTLLQLDLKLLPEALASAQQFPLKVPRGFLARIQKGNMHDPLLQQILPLGKELENTAGYIKDPLKEAEVNPTPGLLHKYHGRVLLTLTGVCAINCRYCFRREFPYEKNNPGKTGWQEAFQYITNDPSISEVILSGGDPLISTDDRLKRMTDLLTTIPHVKRLRIHTRIPIVLPERITTELITWLNALSLQKVIVLHCNHPAEISLPVKEAVQKLTDAGAVLLNQSVLLKGINDEASTLIALSETLFDAGILPYYLHKLDKIQGTAHFDVAPEVAQKLHETMLAHLPGYLVPKWVCEQPGAASKLSFNSLELCTD